MEETLTDFEKNLVEMHRQEESKKFESEAFYRISVILASEWQTYALPEGYHLTYSVFIDGFGVQDRLEKLDHLHGLNGILNDVSPKWFMEAVKRALDGVASYTNDIYDMH